MKKTSEVTHTRGAWTLQDLGSRPGYPDWHSYAIRSLTTNVCIAVVGNVDRYYEGKELANARLIAAAPELLEACKGGLVALEELAVIANSWYPDTYSQISKARDIARAAIAKATGSATATLAPLKEQL